MLRQRRVAAAAGSDLALTHAPGAGGGAGSSISRSFGDNSGFDDGPTSMYS